MNAQQIAAIVTIAYWALLGRAPESQAAIDGWVAKAGAGGANLNAMVSEIANTPEAQAHQAQVAGVIRAVGGQVASQAALAKAFGA